MFKDFPLSGDAKVYNNKVSFLFKFDNIKISKQLILINIVLHPMKKTFTGSSRFSLDDGCG